jgi:hypothetical protein
LTNKSHGFPDLFLQRPSIRKQTSARIVADKPKYFFPAISDSASPLFQANCAIMHGFSGTFVPRIFSVFIRSSDSDHLIHDSIFQRFTLELCSYDFAVNSFIKEGGCISLALTCIYYSCMYLCSFHQEAAAAAAFLASSGAAVAKVQHDGDEGKKRPLHVTLET